MSEVLPYVILVIMGSAALSGALSGAFYYKHRATEERNRDSDGDGYISVGFGGTDCDDGNSLVHPDREERCPLAAPDRDDNCDGKMDDAARISTWYQDTDGDGYGNAAVSTVACFAPIGFVSSAMDCDDSDASVNPSATEVCDEVDNDCSGEVDEAFVAYSDKDGDKYGDWRTTVPWDCRNPLPRGSSRSCTDCNDANARVHPNSEERKNGTDDDCDGEVDEVGHDEYGAAIFANGTHGPDGLHW